MDYRKTVFRAVWGDDELAQVADFWREQFRTTAPHLHARPNEQAWLKRSHVFAGFDGSRVVAACRLSPYDPDLGWEASEDIDETLLAPIDSKYCAQLNRVAVVRESRNLRLHEHMFFELSRYVIAHTEFDSFFSIVREPLVRIYRPWAIHPVHEEPIVLPSRGHHSYVIVRGDVAATYRNLSIALGFMHQEPTMPA